MTEKLPSYLKKKHKKLHRGKLKELHDHFMENIKKKTDSPCEVLEKWDNYVEDLRAKKIIRADVAAKFFYHGDNDEF